VFLSSVSSFCLLFCLLSLSYVCLSPSHSTIPEVTGPGAFVSFASHSRLSPLAYVSVFFDLIVASVSTVRAPSEHWSRASLQNDSQANPLRKMPRTMTR